MSEVLRVNPIACDAHGLCAELLPELVRLDDWGYPIVDERRVPKELLSHARRAVDACPTLALALVRAERAAEGIAAVDGPTGGARASSKRGSRATR
jgi:ferredoxin